MINKFQEESNLKMDQAIDHTLGELGKVRTGRANPELLNSLFVDYYGTKTPLNQVATVTVPEPRLITIQPYEKSLIPLIESAIMNSALGLTPNNNGNAIMVPIPALSEERRLDMIKYVHTLVEEGRISVRNVRRDVLHHLTEYGKTENISEDEIRREEQEIQIITDKHITRLGELQELKEKELKII